MKSWTSPEIDSCPWSVYCYIILLFTRPAITLFSEQRRNTFIVWKSGNAKNPKTDSGQIQSSTRAMYDQFVLFHFTRRDDACRRRASAYCFQSDDDCKDLNFTLYTFRSFRRMSRICNKQPFKWNVPTIHINVSNWNPFALLIYTLDYSSADR